MSDLYESSCTSKNIFNMVGSIDDSVLLCLLRFLSECDKERSITINLSTYGGDADVALGIYDVLRQVTYKMDSEVGKNKELIIKGIGPVMSAGVYILQAAHKRLLLPNTTIMLHYGSREINDSHINFVNFARINDILADNLCKILAQRSGRKHSVIHQWLLKDTYLPAHLAVANGLADKVILP